MQDTKLDIKEKLKTLKVEENAIIQINDEEQ